MKTRLRKFRSAARRFGAVFVLTLALVSAVGQGTIVQSWEGIRVPNGAVSWSVPPDPHGAPGPAGIIATVNLQISYYSKSGALIWGATNLSAFWAGVGNTGFGLSDPKAIFDHDSRRFFVILQENTGSRFWFNVAVSRNSDPQSSSGADWRFYRLDATEYAGGNGAGGVNYGGDYPGLAVDSQALYTSYRMYAFNPNGTLNGCGCNYTNVALLILNKNNLLNGTGSLVSLYLTGFQLEPITPFGASPGNVMYLAGLWDSSNLKLVSVTDPLGTRTQNSQLLTIVNRGGGATNGAPQLGSANLIPPINRTLGNASLVGGDVWLCATEGQPGGPAVAAYYRVRLNGWPASGSASIAEDNIVGSGSFWNFCPCIGVNVAGDVCMTWTRSSSGTYATMMYAARTASDVAFGTPQVVKVSDTANNDGRWGDYMSAWPDPFDGSFWITSEWTRSDTGTWSTWWAQIQMPPKDFYVQWNAPFPLIQNGSITFPYLQVRTAHDNITRGTIRISGGHYNEQGYFDKPVTLDNYGSAGAATIGAP